MGFYQGCHGQDAIMTRILIPVDQDMAEQQLKEAVLTFTILYMAGDQDRESKDSEVAGMFEEDLDKCCEDFLLQHFGLKV